MDQSISKKIALLNQTTLDSLAEVNILKIIERFTETGLKILGANFGFAWWKNPEDDKYKLAYKSPNTPYEPKLPREHGGNFMAEKNKTPIFVEKTIKENYEKKYDVSPYMESYAIIPIIYKNYLYGNLVICFEKEHIFTDEDKELSASLGNTTAQTIIIHRFIEQEHKTLKKAEMLKYTWKLLKEEKLKTEFIANATHELRTPLAIIKGNVDLATKGDHKKLKSTKSALRAIDHEIKHLVKIISDLTLMTSSNVWESNNKIVYKKVNLKSLVAHVAVRSKALAYKNKISIIAKNIPNIFIFGDKKYLEKMLFNLVKNSITYNKKNGYTKITVEETKDNFVTINITDNGIGISKKDLPRIFERFYRANKSRSSYARTGLGLAIVKWIAEIHGGEVFVKSIKNKGSVFSISLPIEKIKEI